MVTNWTYYITHACVQVQFPFFEVTSVGINSWMGLHNSIGFVVSLVKTLIFADLTLPSLPGSNSSILAILQRHLEVPCSFMNTIPPTASVSSLVRSLMALAFSKRLVSYACDQRLVNWVSNLLWCCIHFVRLSLVLLMSLYSSLGVAAILLP